MTAMSLPNEAADRRLTFRGGIDMRMKHLFTTVVMLSALTAVEAQAANSVSVLQFGATNLSSTVQTGPVNNTATTLQFGATNIASSLQLGSLASVNSATIGQGGTTPHRDQ
ncbi:hypothetical protein [Bradyrhizobium sp. AS23.2]|uniref:hypothetical protein n=1 Tax=Bradyrhizobium sp. AS23.2 TaxID=1680155 RepID=UPI001FD9B740|nr:hypothetical protein [Bradyrhizobium sp. AS23.2]